LFLQLVVKLYIMENKFKLRVPVGSVIVGQNFKLKLKSIPDEAYDLWSKGAGEFELTKEGVVLLESKSINEINELIKIREPHNYSSELKVLKEVLKSLNSTIRKAK